MKEDEEIKNKGNAQKKSKKMVDISPTLSIIPLNIKDLNM